MINAGTQIKSGISGYSKAVKIILQNKMAKYFAVPIIINIIIISILWHYSGELSDFFTELINDKFTISETWNGFLGGATAVLTKLLTFAIFIFVGGNIVILIMSPFYSMMSEKTDTILTGREYQFSAKQTAKDIWRGIIIALKNTIIQLIMVAVCFIISFIPVIGVVGTIMMFLINSYYFGFSFLDYNNERFRRSRSQSNAVVKRYKWLSITIGAFYALSLYVVCGTFIAVFIGGVSTVAAAVAQIELESMDNIEN